MTFTFIFKLGKKVQFSLSVVSDSLRPHGLQLFNMLSTLVIAFLPRSKHLLISRLQSPSALILDPKKIKTVTLSIVSPSIRHEVMVPDVMIFVF